MYGLGYQGSLGDSKVSSLRNSEVSLSQPVKVHRVSSDPNVPAGNIDAAVIDPTHQPPAERLHKPIACFYLRFLRAEAQKDDFYRAVYLGQRTVRDLLEKISLKQRIDPNCVVRVLLINQSGLKIMVDDDVVRELPGRDMDVEVSEAFAALVTLREPQFSLS